MPIWSCHLKGWQLDFLILTKSDSGCTLSSLGTLETTTTTKWLSWDILIFPYTNTFIYCSGGGGTLYFFVEEQKKPSGNSEQYPNRSFYWQKDFFSLELDFLTSPIPASTPIAEMLFQGDEEPPPPQNSMEGRAGKNHPLQSVQILCGIQPNKTVWS